MKMACKYGNNKVQRWPIKPIITVFTDGLSDPSCRRRRITTHPPYGAHSSTADQALNVATRAFTSPHNPVRPYASLRVATHAYASPHTPPPPPLHQVPVAPPRGGAYASPHTLTRRYTSLYVAIPALYCVPPPSPFYTKSPSHCLEEELTRRHTPLHVATQACTSPLPLCTAYPPPPLSTPSPRPTASRRTSTISA